MSALRLKADIAECDWNVRFVPVADIDVPTRLLGQQFAGYEWALEVRALWQS
jgi:hypothetical protein